MSRTKKVNGVTVDFTSEQEAARDVEEQAWDNRVIPPTYIAERQAAYLPTDDQLDLIYWDQVNGTTTFKEHREKVKADYPKE